MADLPVGQNLQDHQGILLGPFFVNDSSKLSCISNNLTEEHFEEYLEMKEDGVLSTTGYGPQGFYVSAVARKTQPRWPDIHVFIVNTNFGSAGLGHVSEIPENQFSVVVYVGRPQFNKSTLGRVELNTKEYKSGERDNTKLAILDYKFMENTRDYMALLSGISVGKAVHITLKALSY